ncbi:hypothetical protein BOMU111920_17720 [Bordetella muralis]|jgi:hypothetical protein
MADDGSRWGNAIVAGFAEQLSPTAFDFQRVLLEALLADAWRSLTRPFANLLRG